MIYKVKLDTNGNIYYLNGINEDGSFISIPTDQANRDYQVYLKWLEEGNEPLPADE